MLSKILHMGPKALPNPCGGLVVGLTPLFHPRSQIRWLRSALAARPMAMRVTRRKEFKPRPNSSPITHCLALLGPYGLYGSLKTVDLVARTVVISLGPTLPLTRTFGSIRDPYACPRPHFGHSRVYETSILPSRCRFTPLEGVSTPQRAILPLSTPIVSFPCLLAPPST